MTTKKQCGEIGQECNKAQAKTQAKETIGGGNGQMHGGADRRNRQVRRVRDELHLGGVRLGRIAHDDGGVNVLRPREMGGGQV